MPWVRLDDRFPSHRKVALLSDRAFRLHVSALCWASENLTEGRVLESELRVIAHVRGAKTAAKELEDRKLWDRVDGGWMIHDFLEYNPDRAKVQAERDANAARQQAWRDRKKAEKEVKAAAEKAARNAGRNEGRNGVTHGASESSDDTNATATRHEDDANLQKHGGAKNASPQVSEIRNAVNNGTPAPAPAPTTSFGSSAAAASDPEPRSYDTLADLKRAISAAGISGISWNLQASQIERARRVCDRIGVGPMVAMAAANARLKGAPAGASAWLGDWESLEPDPAGGRPNLFAVDGHQRPGGIRGPVLTADEINALTLKDVL